jgi:RES domain-containing protein
MVLWRISNHLDLEGYGGQRGDARWHTAAPGKRIVYFAEHPALALVEILVNLRAHRDFLPEKFQLLRVDLPQAIQTLRIAEDSLDGNWRDNLTETQAIGNEWLKLRKTALLAVPSAPAPESWNYLWNPLHSDAAGASIAWSKWIRYDRRLFRLSE